jgi:hypothetical protein
LPTFSRISSWQGHSGHAAHMRSECSMNSESLANSGCGMYFGAYKVLFLLITVWMVTKGSNCTLKSHSYSNIRVKPVVSQGWIFKETAICF